MGVPSEIEFPIIFKGKRITGEFVGKQGLDDIVMQTEFKLKNKLEMEEVRETKFKSDGAKFTDTYKFKKIS